MNSNRQYTTGENIPFLTDLESFYKHVKARPPLHRDFDIREIDPEVVSKYDHIARPFRHCFYCISLFLEGDITFNAGFWKARINKPALYVKTPWQVVSWMKPERWVKEYFVVFTENFLRNHKIVADLIYDMPFVQLEKTIPFELEPDEVELLTGIYKQVLLEYRSDSPDKFSMLASYVHTLLLHVRRLYHKYAQTDEALSAHVHDHERMLVEKFRDLIRQSLALNVSGKQSLTIKYLADRLAVHPNHLNAVVRRQKNKTAIALLHDHILYEAQSLLNQTQLPIKDIAFRLGFVDASHFNNFFRKQTSSTPAIYRKEKTV